MVFFFGGGVNRPHLGHPFLAGALGVARVRVRRCFHGCWETLFTLFLLDGLVGSPNPLNGSPNPTTKLQISVSDSPTDIATPYSKYQLFYGYHVNPLLKKEVFTIEKPCFFFFFKWVFGVGGIAKGHPISWPTGALILFRRE